MKAGRVSLVGAGPGDPGLITVAGLDRIREGDVIVYDRLVNPRLLGHAREGAELINVGKMPDDSHDQEAINRLLIEKAREGKRVVRLKGGDPFVFGRGGEEAEALRAAGIDFEIVPGVTSAVAVPAYAGIPVTHRGVAQSFAVITAHEADPHVAQGPSLEPGRGTGLDLRAVGADDLVFLMGVKTLPEVVRKLTEAGRAPETPVAVISWGTTPEQRTVTGTLADIVDRVREAGITAPAVTVVGDVVRLRETLSWFESRPLFGKRVLITRTRKQASVLARLLADEGAIPIELPSIEIEPSADPAAVDAATARLAAGDYAWVVFTSANAVEEWFRHLSERDLDARAFGHFRGSGIQPDEPRGSGIQPDQGGTRVAAIGPATAEALASRGIRPDLIPPEYVAESILEAMKPHLVTFNFQLSTSNSSPRILLPRAENARPELPDGLRALGAEVDEVTLYRAAVPTDAPAEALEMLRRGEIDIVTFTSSSTVRNLVAMLNGSIEALTGEAPVILSSTAAGNRQHAPSRRNLGRGGKGRTSEDGPPAPRRPLIACIGPITAQTARELGLSVDVEAPEHTVDGLVAAVKEYALGDKAMQA
jgi:uroporphyrinogen III methyltransferase/synthase